MQEPEDVPGKDLPVIIGNQVQGLVGNGLTSAFTGPSIQLQIEYRMAASVLKDILQVGIIP
jgi:hypothetical protein